MGLQHSPTLEHHATRHTPTLLITALPRPPTQRPFLSPHPHGLWINTQCMDSEPDAKRRELIHFTIQSILTTRRPLPAGHRLGSAGGFPSRNPGERELQGGRDIFTLMLPARTEVLAATPEP